MFVETVGLRLYFEGVFDFSCLLITFYFGHLSIDHFERKLATIEQLISLLY